MQSKQMEFFSPVGASFPQVVKLLFHKIKMMKVRQVIVTFTVYEIFRCPEKLVNGNKKNSR
jgi:hypothetical protein